MNASGGGGEASQPPGEGANPFPPDRPGKRALWELLAHHYPQGATMATLADDPRLQELWPGLAKGKSRKTKIGGELGSDRGKHFVKVAVEGAELWVLRTLAQHAAAPVPAGAAAPVPAAGEVPAAASPRAAKAAARAAAAGGGSGHVVLGNTSEAPRWRAATAEFLEKHLLRCHVSVGWEGPQQFYEGRIIEILWEAMAPPEGPLLLLKVLYDDQQEEWIQPTSFHVAGAEAETMVVVERFAVYIWDPSLRRYVPDPHQGEEPPEAAQDAAAPAAGTTTAAAAAPAGQQQQQQGQAGADRGQPAGGPRASHSGSGGKRRRPAEGDRTRGRWWQQAVTGERDASSPLASVPGTAGGSPDSVPQGPAAGQEGEQAQAAAAGAAGAGQPIPAAEAAAAAEQSATFAGSAGTAAGTGQPALQQPAQQQQQEQDRAAMQGQQRGAHQRQAQPAEQSQQQGGQQEQAQHAAALERTQQDTQAPSQHQERELAAREKRRSGSALASPPLSPHKMQAQMAEAAAVTAGRPSEQQVAGEKKRQRDAEQAEQLPQAHNQQQPPGKRPRSGAPSAPAVPASKGFTIPKRAPAAAACQGPAAAAAPAAGGFTIPKRAPPAAAPAAAAEEAARGAGTKGKPTVAGAPFRIPKAAPPAAGGAPASDDLPGGSAGSKLLRLHQDEGPTGNQHAQHPQRGRAEPARRERHEHQQHPQQQRQQPAERHGRQEPASPPAPRQQQQQQQAEKRRPRSPAADPAPQAGHHLLRRSTSLIARNMGLVRWAAPASEAALPTPAATQAAASQPPLQALRDRLAAAGPWPGGDSPGARQAALPAGTHHGRIFISKRETLSACFERGLFVSNSPLDLEGLQEGMLAVMHSLDERLVYGTFRVLAWGRRLDPSFPLPDFQYHVRVQPLRLFQPLPADLLDAFCERKLHPKSGERMKFFDRHLSQKQCRQLWALLQFYCDKLHPELDMRHRFGSAFGEGWQKLLEAGRAGEAGGAASNDKHGGGGRPAGGGG